MVSSFCALKENTTAFCSSPLLWIVVRFASRSRNPEDSPIRRERNDVILLRNYKYTYYLIYCTVLDECSTVLPFLNVCIYIYYTLYSTVQTYCTVQRTRTIHTIHQNIYRIWNAEFKIMSTTVSISNSSPHKLVVRLPSSIVLCHGGKNGRAQGEDCSAWRQD